MVASRRTQRWQQIALVAVLLFGALMVVNLCRTGYALWRNRHDLADLQYRHDRLAREQAALDSEVQFLQSPEGTEAALRRMGNVKPGERPVRFIEPAPAVSQTPDSPPWPLIVQQATRDILRHRFTGPD